MPKIHPFLWFDDRAEEAMDLYVSVFPNSKVLSVSRYSEAGQEIHGRPPGSLMTADFELDGVRVTALNGGPLYQFTEAVSFVIDCEGQAEVDHYWGKLGLEGGEPGRCGWLKDRFGVSWQVVPRQLFETIGGSDAAGRNRAMTAMMKMGKLDVAALEAAYAGKD